MNNKYAAETVQKSFLKGVTTHLGNRLERAIAEGDGRTAIAIWHYSEHLQEQLKARLERFWTADKGGTIGEGKNKAVVKVLAAAEGGETPCEKFISPKELTEEQRAIAIQYGLLVKGVTKKNPLPRRVTIAVPPRYQQEDIE